MSSAYVGASAPRSLTRSAGAPFASTRKMRSASKPLRRRRRSGLCSKASTVTGRAGPPQPAERTSSATRAARSIPIDRKCASCLISITTPTVRPSAGAAPATRSRTSRSRRIGSVPSKRALSGRTSGIRSRTVRVLSSSQVKSSVNQPVMETPSMRAVRRRSANSGRSATSVVPEISFSWRTTSTPSLVATTSGSTASHPIRIASSYAERECSGRYPEAPRCAITSGAVEVMCRGYGTAGMPGRSPAANGPPPSRNARTSIGHPRYAEQTAS